VTLKSSIKDSFEKKYYAMRVIKENPYYLSSFSFHADEHLFNVERDRNIGKLGKKCRFIVETVSTFANKVKFNYKF